MERTGARDGVALRPNNSLASVPGPAGLVSGGNGSGLRVPLSCAFAVPYTHVRTAQKVSAAFVTASGAILMTIFRMALEGSGSLHAPYKTVFTA